MDIYTASISKNRHCSIKQELTYRVVHDEGVLLQIFYIFEPDTCSARASPMLSYMQDSSTIPIAMHIFFRYPCEHDMIRGRSDPRK